jgi:precorrin-6B methylase 2
MNETSEPSAEVTAVSTTRRALHPCAVLAALLLAGATAAAQDQSRKEPYKPIVGMPGKDAVWVPTSHEMIETMLDLAQVTPKDFVMDLGSGDGRAIIAAARRGARGRGVEYNEELVEYSKRLAKEAGVADRAEFVQGDMYVADISDATVLALFLLPSNIERLVPSFLKLPPGTRIVANTFWVEGWSPDESVTMEDNCESWCTAHLFVIPANVGGRWKLPEGELTLMQEYQMIGGSLVTGGTSTPVNGKLNGHEIVFTAGGTEYAGRVDGYRMEGVARAASGSTNWSAVRVQ